MSHFAFVAFLVLFVVLRWRAQARRAEATPRHPPVSLTLGDDAPRLSAPSRPAAALPGDAADEVIRPEPLRPRAPSRRDALGTFYRTVYGPGLCSPR